MVTKDVNCDRMIIATAQVHKLVIITTDEIFEAYEIETLC